MRSESVRIVAFKADMIIIIANNNTIWTVT